MAKTFRDWDVEQRWLLPPSVMDFVPADHIAHFIRDTVREQLDLSAILAPYEKEERGYPPYNPVMMTALLLYAYCQGVYSSRRIARGCEERMDFMAVTGLNRPDFRTVSDFRKRHLEALQGLFVQVLTLCQHAGLVKLGHVSLDGTKVKANASKHKAMSYDRMRETEKRLKQKCGSGSARRSRPTRRRIVSTEARGAGTRCLSGLPTNSSGSRRSVKRARRWRPRRARQVRRLRNPRRSATLPIRRAASCASPARNMCRPTTRRRRWTRGAGHRGAEPEQ